MCDMANSKAMVEAQLLLGAGPWALKPGAIKVIFDRVTASFVTNIFL